MSDFKYSYKPGMRVGLLARVLDTHDKGNIVLQVEGTDLHVQLPESKLLGGVDLVCGKLREKHEAEERAAAEAAAEPEDLGGEGSEPDLTQSGAPVSAGSEDLSKEHQGA